MTGKLTVDTCLKKAIREASVFNPEVQVAPACILWPDRDRQWEAIISRLRAEMPELLVLGEYAPDKRTGPAIWLRCVMARTVDEVSVPEGSIPIFYLPGVGRQDLRAIESCPDYLKPLAELQYRGTLWSQINGKDWTILAFLSSDQGGLGLDVAQDSGAKSAMQLALHRLLDEEVGLLRGKRLDKDYFNTLLTGGDPVRDVLHWLDQGDSFRESRGENEWRAFVEVCRSQLAFDPEHEGILAGAAKLASHEGPWRAVWDRFCEAPTRYPSIPAQIRKCQVPVFDLFTAADAAGGWPQWNDFREADLSRDLQALSNEPPHAAREKIIELEKKHRERRKLVWAELGEAPLAKALEPLSTMAKITQNGLAAGSAKDLAVGYNNGGWKADDALLQALSVISRTSDLAPVAAAIRAVYLPWAEESARHLQQVWVQGKARKGEAERKEKVDARCVLFVDGLRFDCAKRLVRMLEEKGRTVKENPAWAALPTVTGTGKPAVAPIHNFSGIAEEPEPYNFEPITSYQLKKLLADNGWTLLEKNQPCPSPQSLKPSKLWVEFGDMDHAGHDRGWKLAKYVDVLLEEIQEKIQSLLLAGWKNVHVVTDHGWLLLPGGLPKVDMPKALSENKWGRCATIKPGASVEERLYPWFWNPNYCFALADGISCFRKGEEYAHGGLSLQEALTLELVVSEGAAGSGAAIEWSDIVWKGLRCKVAIEGDFAGLSLDIRLQPGNSNTSVVMSTKPLTKSGTASVVVEDEDLEGREATLVLLDDGGALVAQHPTITGGGNRGETG